MNDDRDVRQPKLTDATPEQPNPDATGGSPPARGTPSGMRGRVLLVEDNPDNQELAKTVLEFLGLEVEQAHNGREALARVEQGVYDLVLMDCQMPVMDGYQAATAIRQRLAQAPARLPIVALTANSTEADRDKCLACGMDDHLAKPFTLSQLQQTLARWLPGGAARGDSRAAVAAPPPPPERDFARLSTQRLEELRELDPSGGLGLAKKLAAAFAQTSVELLRQAEEALSNGDADVLRRATHSLKSSSANVGASALSDLFRELEACGREGRLADAKPLLAAAVPAHAQVCAALQDWLGQG